jgi:hypothetical protein
MGLYQRPSEFVIWEIDTPKGRPKSTKAKDAVEKKQGSKTTHSLPMTTIVKFDKLKIENLGKFITTTSAAPMPTAKSALRKRSNSTPAVNPTSSPANSRSSSTVAFQTDPITVSLDTSHPHHFDHPENYVEESLIKTGLVHSRSSSLSKLIRMLNTKTPPSPHHHSHPLKTIKVSDDYNDVIKTMQVDELNGTRVECNANQPRIIEKTIEKSIDTSRTKTVKYVYSQSDAKALEIDNLPNTNPKSLQNLARTRNDYPIENSITQHIMAKNRVDGMHVPMQRVFIDLSSLFLEKTSVTASAMIIRNRLQNGIFNITSDGPLLTEGYKKM